MIEVISSILLLVVMTTRCVPGSEVGEFSVEIINEVSESIISGLAGITVIQRCLQQVDDHCFVIELQDTAFKSLPSSSPYTVY